MSDIKTMSVTGVYMDSGRAWRKHATNRYLHGCSRVWRKHVTNRCPHRCSQGVEETCHKQAYMDTLKVWK